MILSLLLAPALAGAAESSCVKVFEQNYKSFVKQRAKLEKTSSTAKWVSGAAAVGGLGLATRTLPGGAVVIMFSGVAYLTSTKTSQAMSEMFDAHRIYSIYIAHVDKDSEVPLATKEMMEELGVDVQKEEVVLNELASLMQKGQLCVGPEPKRYDDVLDLLRKNLGLE